MAADAGQERAPHYVDRHVGHRIRGLRRRLHVSQEKLAETLGPTFQQVQKYEKGANRISASKLFEVAAALGVEVQFFFEGLDRSQNALVDSGTQGDEFVEGVLVTAEGQEIDQHLLNLTLRQRRLVRDFARGLAG